MIEPILTILFVISCLTVLLVFVPKSRFLLLLSYDEKVKSERDRMFVRGIGELIASFAAYPALFLLGLVFSELIDNYISIQHGFTIIVIIGNFTASWGLRRWWKRIILTLNGYVQKR
jgi:hypothetical protein